MSRIAIAARSFMSDEEGATMVEYALIVAVIALVALVGAKLLGNAVNNKFDGEATSVTSGNP